MSHFPKRNKNVAPAIFGSLLSPKTLFCPWTCSFLSGIVAADMISPQDYKGP